MASLLVPRLALPDLQALHQTCSSSRRIVQAASLQHWQAAAKADAFLPGSLQAAGLYQSAAELAALHRGVRAGPTIIHAAQTVQPDRHCARGCQAAEELSLQPDFSAVLRLGSGGNDLVPVNLLPEAHAGAPALQGSLGTAAMPAGSIFEDSCSPDGAHVLLSLRAACSCLEGKGPSSDLCLYQVKPLGAGHVHLPSLGQVEAVAWAPNSKSFAVHGVDVDSEDDGPSFRYMVASGVGGTAPLNIWFIPVDPREGQLAYPEALCHGKRRPWAFSPCSRYLCIITWRYAIIVDVQQQEVVTHLALGTLSHACSQWQEASCMAWVTAAGHLGVAVWGQSICTDARDDTHCLVHVHFVAPGAAESWGWRVAEMGSLVVGYGLAGFRSRRLALHNVDICTCEVGPAILTEQYLSSSFQPQGLLAWAPKGSFWLALLSVDRQPHESDAARLAVIDGRTGRTRCQLEVARSADGLVPQSLAWSSSGYGLVITLASRRGQGCGCGRGRKLYVSFRHQGLALGRV